MNAQPSSFLAAVAIVTSSVVVACQDVDPPSGSVTPTQDGTGVAIVENARPPDGSRLGWRVGPEPVVSIGQREGGDAYMLFRVTDATRLSDGRVVVVNGGSELRVFDGAGTHVATWGRLGDGPGEFRLRHFADRPSSG